MSWISHPFVLWLFVGHQAEANHFGSRIPLWRARATTQMFSGQGTKRASLFWLVGTLLQKNVEKRAPLSKWDDSTQTIPSPDSRLKAQGGLLLQQAQGLRNRNRRGSAWDSQTKLSTDWPGFLICRIDECVCVFLSAARVRGSSAWTTTRNYKATTKHQPKTNHKPTMVDKPGPSVVATPTHNQKNVEVSERESDRPQLLRYCRPNKYDIP